MTEKHKRSSGMPPQKKEVLYKDHLIKVCSDGITFFCYYFPTTHSKQVKVSDIKSIKRFNPGLWTGKYRLFGTGDFITWYPWDAERAKRDAIYIAALKSQRIRIGFTVVNSPRMEQALGHCGVKIIFADDGT